MKNYNIIHMEWQPQEFVDYFNKVNKYGIKSTTEATRIWTILKWGNWKKEIWLNLKTNNIMFNYLEDNKKRLDKMIQEIENINNETVLSNLTPEDLASTKESQ